MSYLSRAWLFTVLAILSASLCSNTYADEVPFQTYGFTHIESTPTKGVNFACQDQCIISAGTLAESWDVLVTSGQLNWTGDIWYGYLIGEQFFAGEMEAVSGQVKLQRSYSLGSAAIYSQLPKNAMLVIVFVGQFKSTQFNFKTTKFTLGERIEWAWGDFWKFDKFRPYTINLLYGPRVGGGSVNGIFYWILILAIILIWIVSLSTTFKRSWLVYTLILTSGLWMLYDIRMGLETMSYYTKDIETLSKNSTFRDRRDFYIFTDYAKKTLETERVATSEIISLQTIAEWPYKWSIEYMLYPYSFGFQLKDAKTYIVYDNPAITLTNNTLQLSKEVTLKGKSFIFRPGAYIFIRE